MRHSSESRPILFCWADAVAVAAAGALLGTGALGIGIAAAAWLVSAVAFRLCDHRWWSDPSGLVPAAAKTWMASSVLCLAAAAWLPALITPLRLLALPLAALVFGLALRGGWRWAAARRHKPIVIADAVGEERLAVWVRHYWPEWRIAAVVDGRDASAVERAAVTHGADVACYLNGQASPESWGRLNPLSLDDLLECVTGRVLLDHADAVAPPASRVNTALKRMLDLCVGCAGLVVALPLMAVLVALIKLESRGPAIYRQERLGLDGRPFQMLKFRSMIEEAEEETGPVWARDDDPRCTKLGRFIRPLHFDELPQLFNVLRGNMSLVGPRPERPELARDFLESLPAYDKRHAVKPGITGWAQVNQGYDREMDDVRNKIQYDLYYVKRAGPLFDAAIILRTMDAVLFGKPPRPAEPGRP
ncbi:MAG: sugar transferase [Armatimonadota bacterium]|nr:MAG: sugar transferase [Armatimonadota bacterium]